MRGEHILHGEPQGFGSPLHLLKKKRLCLLKFCPPSCPSKRPDCCVRDTTEDSTPLRKTFLALISEQAYKVLRGGDATLYP
jgi:hypothetical protein